MRAPFQPFQAERAAARVEKAHNAKPPIEELQRLANKVNEKDSYSTAPLEDTVREVLEGDEFVQEHPELRALLEVGILDMFEARRRWRKRLKQNVPLKPGRRKGKSPYGRHMH